MRPALPEAARPPPTGAQEGGGQDFGVASVRAPVGLRPRCGNGRCCTSEWKWGKVSWKREQERLGIRSFTRTSWADGYKESGISLVSRSSGKTLAKGFSGELGGSLEWGSIDLDLP